jgi:hypothetical protein
MPVFNNPRQVIVTEGGTGALAVIAAVLVIAAIISAEAVLIAQVIQAILVTAVTALAGSSAVAVLVFRRTGVWVVWRPPILAGRVVRALPARPSRPAAAAAGQIRPAAAQPQTHAMPQLAPAAAATLAPAVRVLVKGSGVPPAALARRTATERMPP